MTQVDVILMSHQPDSSHKNKQQTELKLSLSKLKKYLTVLPSRLHVSFVSRSMLDCC